MKSAKRLCCLALAFAMMLTSLPPKTSAQTDSLLPQNTGYSLPSTIQPLQPTVEVQSDVEDPAIQGPSGIPYNTRVVHQIITTGQSGEATTRAAIVRFTLTNPGPLPVTFRYTALSGSAYTTRHLAGSLTGTVTLTEESPVQDISIGIATFSDNPGTHNLPNPPDAFWTGTRLFYLYCESIQNAQFDGDKNSLSIPVPVESTFDYPAAYQSAINTRLIDLNEVSGTTAPGVYPVPTGGELHLTALIAGDVRTLLDAGVLTHLELPEGYFHNSGPTSAVNYEMTRSQNVDGMDALSVYDEIIDLPENTQTPFYTESLSGERPVSDVSLGPAAEGNGLFNRLDFLFKNLAVPDPGLLDIRFLDEDGQYLRWQVGFSDKTSPSVMGISTPSTSFHCGDQVPIILHFSEPVLIDGIAFEVDGSTLYPLEDAGTISESVSFLYQISEEVLGTTTLSITTDNIAGAVDLSGKPQQNLESHSTNISLVALDPIRTFTCSAALSVILNQGGSRNASAAVSISLHHHTHLSNWLMDPSRLGESNVSTAVKAKAITSEGIMDVPLTVQTDGMVVTGLAGAFMAPENMTDEAIPYALEVYLDSGSGYSLAYGLTTIYAVQPLTLIDEEGDLSLVYANWPPMDNIFPEEGTNLALDYLLHVSPTWQDASYFVWSSSNEEIATIDMNGTITLTSVPGAVRFTLAVSNPLSDEPFLFESRTLTVLEAENAFLYVPDALKQKDLLLGSDASIRFSSNLTQRNRLYSGSGTETPYTFTLYEASYAGETAGKGMQLSEETMLSTAETPIPKHDIPAHLLTNTTEKGQFGYILMISARDLQSEQTYTDEIAIRVRSLPARAVLTNPQNAYLTDELNSFPLQFNIENQTAGTDFLLTVTKNNHPAPAYSTSDSSQLGLSIPIPIPIDTVDAGRLLDVYTVTLKAKNLSDEAWSFASHEVYVYRAYALKFMMNGFPAPSSLTMQANFNDGDVLYGTHLLLASRSSLGLTKQLTIDGTAHAWNVIADRVTWQVEGDSISLWYRDGTGNRRIGGDHTPILLPGTSMTIRAESAGTSVARAMHTLTGMTASINVTVNPLNDKLFLFQTYPRIPCEIHYVNGSGIAKTVSAPFGEVGIYEVSGIAGDVTIHPTSGAETSYEETILNRNTLLMNQRTTDRYDLYPINTVKMPSANYRVSLQLVNATNGSTHTGEVIVRGGAYLNGVYQPATRINGIRGDEDQSLIAGDSGQYILSFRPADFTDRLRATDKLTYVLEVAFPGNTHHIRYITVEHDAIRAGRHSPLGTTISADIHPIDVTSIQNSVVVLSQRLTVDGEERSFSELHYLEEVPDSVLLEMTCTIPGDPGNHYRLYLEQPSDLLGGSFSPAEVVTSYPFSSHLTLRFSYNWRFTLAYLMSYVSKPGETILFTPMIKNHTTGAEVKLSKPIRILNLKGIPRMNTLQRSGSDYNDIYWLFINMSNSASEIVYSGNNEAVKYGLEILADFALYSTSMGLEVKPTADPLVYKGILRFAAGSYSKENPSGVFVGSGDTVGYNFTPGASDMKAMAKGTFLKKAKKEMNSRGYKSYGGGAYVDCEIYYSIEEKEWKIRLLYGDVYLGGGGVYQRNYNAWISFVPVTATFRTSLTAELGLQILNNGRKTAYIPRVRPVFSIYGFGGIGRDYTVVSLKAGPYGYAEHEQLYLWYEEEDEASLHGQRLKIYGETGVEFNIKLTYLELNGKYVLASGSHSWLYNDFNTINNKLPPSYRHLSAPTGAGPLEMSMFAGDESASFLIPLDESVSFEDRSYLGAFERSWGAVPSGDGMHALASDDDLTALWTNAYPYSAPTTTDDGRLMAYLSDLDSENPMDTAACLTSKGDDGSYPEGIPIHASVPVYPDSSLSIAGTKDHASAVWVRSFTGVSGASGVDVTAADVVNALASTEIMAGIHNGDTTATTRLTTNDTPDLSPVTAASGNKALIAWRSVSLGSLENPLDFTRDEIQYSLFNGITWSDPASLYDGSYAGVNTLHAAMLPDGTSAVIYQTTDGDTGSSVVDCAILNPAGATIGTLRLSGNDLPGRNPQLTVTEFPDGESQFVAGWTDVSANGDSTLRLAAINADGTRLHAFAPGSPEETGTTSDASTFHFAKGASHTEDLSVIWHEPEDDDNDGVYGSAVYGMKLLQAADGTLSLSGRQKLLTLSEGRLISTLDSRVDAGTQNVNLTLLIQEAGGASTLATVTTDYQNRITVSEPEFGYEDVLPGLTMPILFTFRNDGIIHVSRITIGLGVQTEIFEAEPLQPGETRQYQLSHPVPDPVLDVPYSVTAQFGDTGGIAVETGSLALSLPDVGIREIVTTKEVMRERGFRVWLQNDASGALVADKHAVILKVSTAMDDEIAPLFTQTLATAEALATINNSLLPIDIMLSEADLQALLDENGEFPAGGAPIYFRVSLQEHGQVVPDADISNDIDYAWAYSLIEQNGTTVSLSSLLQTVDGITTVQVEAFNNSMNPVTNGDLIVTLRDANGSMLETRRTYNPANAGSLLAIAGEEAETAQLSFNQTGVTADVIFAPASDDGTLLAVLQLSGIPFTFEPTGTAYTVQSHGLTLTRLTAITENPASTVTMTRNGAPLAPSDPFSLSYGTTRLSIRVATGLTVVTYTIDVENIRIDDSQPANNRESPTEFTAGLTIDGIQRAGVSFRVTDGLAVMSLGSLAEELFSGSSEAILMVPTIDGANRYRVELPAYALSGPRTGSSLTIVTTLGHVRIPSGMLGGFQDLEGKTAGITITTTDLAMLSEDIRAVVGDRPALSLTLTLDGVKTEWRNPSTPVAVFLPYAPTPAEQNASEGIIVWHVAHNDTLRCIPNGHYQEQTGMVAFLTTHFSDFAVGFTDMHFSDIPEDAWYHQAVNFLAARGVTKGTSEGTYSPSSPLTRGDFLVLLMRAYELEPDEISADNFSDAGNSYYTGYLSAAKRLELARGVGDNKFAPREPITRQDMFILLVQALKALDRLPVVSSELNLSDFTDAHHVSSHALDAVDQLLKAGIVKGSNNLLHPTANSTRAEAAQVLVRLLTGQ